MSLMSDYHINSPPNSSSGINKQSKGARVDCIAVYGNRILSTGFNMDRTHPLQAKYNQFRMFNSPEKAIHKLHAEIACLSPLLSIKNDLNWNKVSLYVYRSCNSREHGYARPCPACMKLIHDLGIRHVYYSTDDGYAYEQIS